MNEFEKAKKNEQIRKKLLLRRVFAGLIMAFFGIIAYKDNKNLTILIIGLIVEIIYIIFFLFPQYRKYKKSQKN